MISPLKIKVVFAQSCTSTPSVQDTSCCVECPLGLQLHCALGVCVLTPDVRGTQQDQVGGAETPPQAPGVGMDAQTVPVSVGRDRLAGYLGGRGPGSPGAGEHRLLQPPVFIPFFFPMNYWIF